MWLLLLSFITLALAGDDPEYDYTWDTNGGEVGECEFEGCVDTQNNACKQETICRDDFQQGGDLTWEILISACPSLKRAGCADEDYDNRDEDDDDYVSMDSLVWPNCGQCPRCSCEESDDYITYYTENSTDVTSTSFESKTCYWCYCFDWYTEDGEDVYARSCYSEFTANSPDELTSYNCPSSDGTTAQPTSAPTGGCDNGDGTMYDSGEYFWMLDEAGGCETYCYCDVNVTSICETGWQNITQSEQLKYTFLDTCGPQFSFGGGFDYGLGDCWNLSIPNITDRWFKNLPGTYCTDTYITTDIYQCPYCDCGDYNDDDDWSDALGWNSAVYDDDGEFSYALYDCLDCTCEPSSFWYDQSYTVCSSYDSAETSLDECVRDNLQCQYGDDNEYDDVFTISCNSDGGATYCGWSQVTMNDEDDPDTVCIEDEIEDQGSWGCQYDYICEAFFDSTELSDSGSQCSNSSVTFTASTYDCVNTKWLSEDYEINVNFMCCNSDDCNDAAISPSGCLTENDAISDFYQAMYECEYSNRGVTNNDFVKAFECDYDLPDNEYDACDLIDDYWTYTTKCDCRAYQALEKNYADDSDGDNLRTELQALFDAAYYSTKYTLIDWNDAYDCGFDTDNDFECDISDDRANSLQLIVPVISTILFAVFYY